MTGLLTRWDTAAGAWSTLACKDQELIPYDIPNVDYSWGLTSLDHTHNLGSQQLLPFLVLDEPPRFSSLRTEKQPAQNHKSQKAKLQS